MIVVRTSFRGAPRRIIFNASNTAPLGRVCAGDGDVGSACRLGNPLAFAIYQRPVSRDASSIAQTDVQHFADKEVMRNAMKFQGGVKSCKRIGPRTPTSGGGVTSSILYVRLSHQLPQIFTLTTQADNNRSICFGDMIWGSYLQRKDWVMCNLSAARVKLSSSAKTRTAC